MGDCGKPKFGSNIRRLRESLGMTQENLAEAAGLDRSYIGGIERGDRNPAFTAILRLAAALKVTPGGLFDGIGDDAGTPSNAVGLSASATSDGLLIRFKYDQYDAEYELPGATRREYDQVVRVLKSGLASSGRRTDAVADTFLTAVQTWPAANPSDLWTFLVNRAYCDRSNHPDTNARLNLEQSWKRTSGWALERVLVRHYQPFLIRHGIDAKISGKTEKAALLGGIDDPRIVPDKADILLSYSAAGVERLLGVVHVKASIAERRTDDVSMSQALIDAGYISVFWTMDAKSMPAERPVNRGEFGVADDDQLSDKRRDFEEHGHFSACFSYNRNTMPTQAGDNPAARISVCDFTDPDDHFSRFLISASQQRLHD